VVNGERVAVSSFSTQVHVSPQHLKNFPDFLRSAATEVDEHRFNYLLVVFDGPLAAASPYKSAFDKTMKILKPEIFSRVHLFEGEQGSGRDKVVEFVKSLTARSSPGPLLVPAGGEASQGGRERSA